MVHSVALGQLEIFEDVLLTVDLRGRIVDVIDLTSPQCGSKDLAERDAVVAGVVAQWAATNPKRFEYLDLSGSGKLLVPGFVDAHAHAPQYAFVGTGMDLPLLQWLETYTFPCEAKFADTDHARRVYSKAVRRSLSFGTTFSSWFATIHLDASKALVDVVRVHGQRAHVGKVSMDRNSPKFYVEKDTRAALRDVEAFVDYVHDTNKAAEDAEEAAVGVLGRSRGSGGSSGTKREPLVTPSIIPRFVPTCSSEMMRGLGNISRTRAAVVAADSQQQQQQQPQDLISATGAAPSFSTLPRHKSLLPVHSHLSESPAEISWVKDLHPDCATYADVYKSHGLLHERSYMAHCCHCCPTERGLLRAMGCGMVHCPSSNFMLKSGVMDVRSALNEGSKVALGSDIAGGYSSNILDAMRQAIIASRVCSFHPPETQGQDSSGVTGGSEYTPLTYAEVFHLATVGGAEVLGMGNELGNLRPGMQFDALVVDPAARGGPIDLFGGESTLERFEKFLFLGDDRNVEQVFVNGIRVMRTTDGQKAWPLAESHALRRDQGSGMMSSGQFGASGFL